MSNQLNNNMRAIGQDAEQQACHYLLAQGLELVEQNYHCRLGEIDLIMRDVDSLVFVEVRYRQNDACGSGAASVNYYKQKKIIKAASYYLTRQGLYDKIYSRFDVVSMSAVKGQAPHIEWIKDAFPGYR